jgi:hypothetical protein
MTTMNVGAEQKRAAALSFPKVGARVTAMALSLGSMLARVVWLALGLVLGFAGGIYAGSADGSLRNEIALQIVKAGGNLNDVRQKVEYLCKSGFIDAEKNSWRRRWFNISNPCDNPTGK